MIIDSNYKDKNKDFSKHENEALIDLFIELCNIQNQISLLSKIEIFSIECKVTDIIKKIVDICNKNIFSNFNLALRIKEIDKNVY